MIALLQAFIAAGRSSGKITARALLLEDEPMIAIDVEFTLAAVGIAVTTVRSCGEANAFLEGNGPDIAIVDVGLTDGSSVSIVAKLVQQGIPFFVYSGDDADLYKSTVFAEGRWIGKPALPIILAEVARALIAV